MLTIFLSRLFLILGFLQPETHSNPPKLTILNSGFIYEKGPFPSCHASTLVETSDGIMASWFGGTHERHPDVSIYTSVLKGGNWSVPVMVADGVENEKLRYPTWNPVLYKKEDGVLVLYYKVGPSPQEWWGVYKTSKDEGKTWSNEIKIPAMLSFESFSPKTKNARIGVNSGIVAIIMELIVGEVSCKP